LKVASSSRGTEMCYVTYCLSAVKADVWNSSVTFWSRERGREWVWPPVCKSGCVHGNILANNLQYKVHQRQQQSLGKQLVSRKWG